MSTIEIHLLRKIQNHLGSLYLVERDENGLLLDLIHIYKQGKHWWNGKQYVATLVVEGRHCGTTDSMLAQELVKLDFRIVVK